MSKKNKATKLSIDIEVCGTDGSKETKTVDLTKPCTIKELLEAYGYAYDQCQVTLSGKKVPLDTVIDVAGEIIALKKRHEEPKPVVQVRQRPQGG